MILNEKQLKILQAINEGKTSETAIFEYLDFSINSIIYLIKELEKHEYIQASWGFSGNSLTETIIYVLLTDKGKVAVENSEDLIQPSSPVMNNIHISGSVNAPISILQDSDNNTVNITQNIDQSVTEVLKSIDYLSQAIQDFPEDEKEIATVHLDDLKNEFQEPEQRNPKKIRAYFMAFLGIALPLLGYVANVTDFVNNLTDLSDKFNIELPQIDIPN